MNAGGYTYILTNDRQTVFYTGSTNDLQRRIRHHKHRLVSGFTKKYNVHRLVYFDVLIDMDAARRREREIKGMSRSRKNALILPSINRGGTCLKTGDSDPADRSIITEILRLRLRIDSGAFRARI